MRKIIIGSLLLIVLLFVLGCEPTEEVVEEVEDKGREGVSGRKVRVEV